MVYQASPVKRRRRTRAQVEQLEAQILAVLEEDRPQSVRHCFYRLTDPRLPEPVAKTEAGYRQVQERLVRMRRAGAIPYSWISDSTRAGYHTATYRSAADFVRRVAGAYRQDLWEDAGALVEVWTESRSLAGALRATCQELAVSLYPCGGFSSLTFVHEAAEAWAACGSPPVQVLYCGDYDAAGVLIDAKLEAEMRRHFAGELGFRRLAVNPDQIRAFDLPAKPRKPSERRRPDIQATVEAEALPAGILRSIVREAVESYLPAGALQAARVAEESERAGLQLVPDLLEGRAADMRG